MFTYGVRNIVHKQSVDDINILYYPNNDIIDDIVTDFDANFFIPMDSVINKSISKDNICYIRNLSEFEYDFILTYDFNDTLMNLCTRLHIPSIIYLKYGSYDDSKIPDYKNVYYILEHEGHSEQEKLLTIVPQINKTIHNIENNICLFISNGNDYGNLIEILHSKIKNLSIVDEQKINQSAMFEILSKHKVCIDLYPKSIYKMLFCASAGLPYVTIPNGLTKKYKEFYDGVYYMEQDLQILLQILARLCSGSSNYKINFTSSDNKNNLIKFLQKIKTKGLVI